MCTLEITVTTTILPVRSSPQGPMFINNSLVSCWGHRELGEKGPHNYHLLGMMSDEAQHSAFLTLTHTLRLESGGGWEGVNTLSWLEPGAWAPDQSAERVGTQLRAESSPGVICANILPDVRPPAPVPSCKSPGTPAMGRGLEHLT